MSCNTPGKVCAGEKNSLHLGGPALTADDGIESSLGLREAEASAPCQCYKILPAVGVVTGNLVTIVAADASIVSFDPISAKETAVKVVGGDVLVPCGSARPTDRALLVFEGQAEPDGLTLDDVSLPVGAFAGLASALIEGASGDGADLDVV